MAVRNPVGFLKTEYEDLVRNELDWKLRVLEGPSAPRCVVDGKKVLMLCSNNYLGLSNHPLLKKAAIEAVNSHGAGSGSVRPIAGNMDLHMELERRLAKFKQAEASLVFQTGFAANAGLIPQLADAGDIIPPRFKHRIVRATTTTPGPLCFIFILLLAMIELHRKKV